MNDNIIGKILGNRYEIIEKIGSGGMATVYKAKCKVLNRNVAIKILKDEFANDAEFIKRFQVEAQSAASLSHPNIVSIFDVGKEDNKHYIVMELIEGKTLKDIIIEKGKIPWKDSVKIAAQIASGLSQAHSHHIVHRDIKPHNIIITKDGVAKVTDFGIAKAVSNSTINAFGSTMGSVHYFSPEHARGGYTDEKSDIYSLGVVLYEMTTGKLPFEAETPVSVALKHLQEQPEEPKNVNPDIPEALNFIILKAMEKEISNRYVSANAFYEDLTKLLKNPDDATLQKYVRDTGSEFPTQRIPVVNINDTNDKNEKVDVKKTIEQDDEKMGKKKGVTKKQALLRAFIFLVLIVAVFWGCVYLGGMISEKVLGSNSTVKMLKIVGLDENEAREQLESIGLKMNVVGSVVSEEYPLPGFVIYQEYAEDYDLKKGDTVDVRISKVVEVTVPDVSNVESTLAAKMKIEMNGNLIYAEEYVYHNVIASGEIIEQKPAANSKVFPGETITVYISKGPASGEEGLVVVPKVEGETEAVAREMLDAVKLIPNITYKKDKSSPDGVVLGQYPTADKYVTELAEIELFVNRLVDPDPETENSGDTENQTSGEKTSDVEPVKPSGEKKNDEEHNNPNQQQLETKRKVVIDLGNVPNNGKFNVKVVLEGSTIGKIVEYEASHTRADGKIDVYVTDIKNGMIKVYINDVVTSEMTF